MICSTGPVEADAVLSVLAAAMGTRRISLHTRVCAAPDARSPEEGLALLSAYISIAEPDVRQAILDAVLVISQRSARERR